MGTSVVYVLDGSGCVCVCVLGGAKGAKEISGRLYHIRVAFFLRLSMNISRTPHVPHIIWLAVCVRSRSIYNDLFEVCEIWCQPVTLYRTCPDYIEISCDAVISLAIPRNGSLTGKISPDVILVNFIVNNRSRSNYNCAWSNYDCSMV